MVAYEVLEVEYSPERNERLLGFAMHVPQPGTKSNVYVLEIIGWVAGTDPAPRAVDVLYHDRVIRTTPVRGPRSDVNEGLGLAPDADLLCDLAAVFATTYERGRYWKAIAYGKAPPVPLSAPRKQWVRRQVRAAARRE